MCEKLSHNEHWCASMCWCSPTQHTTDITLWQLQSTSWKAINGIVGTFQHHRHHMSQNTSYKVHQYTEHVYMLALTLQFSPSSWTMIWYMPPASQLPPTWTTKDTVPMLIRAYLLRAPISMASIPMPRLASWLPPLRTCSALCLRCSPETPLLEQALVPPGRKRWFTSSELIAVLFS